MASILMGITGMLLYDKIKSKFIPEAVIVGFIVGGLLLLLIENKFGDRNHKVVNIDNITLVQAFKIGLLQLLAMWPGMFRSASTIMGGWIAGLSTPIAAEFSFL